MQHAAAAEQCGQLPAPQQHLRIVGRWPSAHTHPLCASWGQVVARVDAVIVEPDTCRVVPPWTTSISTEVQRSGNERMQRSVMIRLDLFTPVRMDVVGRSLPGVRKLRAGCALGSDSSAEATWRSSAVHTYVYNVSAGKNLYSGAPLTSCRQC